MQPTTPASDQSPEAIVLVHGLNGLNDGTVAVSEASLPNATDVVVL